MEWIRTSEQEPPFAKSVLCYCEIHGIYIAHFMQILDSDYGEWQKGKQLNIVPPKFWMPLPNPPQS